MAALTLALMGLNSIVFSVNYQYDEMGRLIAETGRDGQNIRYAYDAEDRVTQVTDSQNRVTRMEYDARGRLLKQVDAAGGVTRLAYDLGDRVSRVTDPRGLTTTYAYDGFGQLWSQTSPDTGTTSHTYDEAGLRTTTARQDGSLLVYAYDGLGRPLSVGAEGQQHLFTYDTCTFGKGRLCTTWAPGAFTGFTYNSVGQLISRTDRTAFANSTTEHTMGYSYDGIGRQIAVTYPDGSVAGYTYDGGGQLSSMSLTKGSAVKSIISNATHTALGDRSRTVFGNGLTRSYAFDSSGRVEAMAVRKPDSTALSRTSYRYSGDNEITLLQDDVTSDLTQSIGYDALSRLTRLDRYGITNHLSYDAGGNHNRYQAGSAVTQYAIDPGSNRVNGYTNADGMRQYTYDALGNRISETAAGRSTTYTYGAFNRMEQSNVDGRATLYRLNAQGQRAGKQNASGTSRYYYAGQNQLMAEHTNGIWTNYLWFDGELVGLLRNGQVSHVHTDHLGRPAYATNGNQQTVWKAYNYAYGRSVAQDDIGGLNIGFPGQYYDAETGLWYNGFRDYDASIARYVQSDPIGLAGGINTYIYADGSPVNRVDPLGLEWVTIGYDYYAMKNYGTWWLNRFNERVSRGLESNMPGSNPGEFLNTQRDVIQEWQDDCQVSQSASDARRRDIKNGTQRRIPQTFSYGPDSWAKGGYSYYWIPGVPDRTDKTIVELKKGSGMVP